MKSPNTSLLKKAIASWLAAWTALSPLGNAAHAATTALSDAPIFATKLVPPNLLLDLSVDWPSCVVAAYNDNADTTANYECPGRHSTGGDSIGVCYFESRKYVGIFDHEKCYTYDSAGKYFTPVAYGTGGNKHI